MAKLEKINLDQVVCRELKKCTVTVTVQIKPVHWFTLFRIWLATRIVALAAWVMGCGFEVEEDRFTQRANELDRIISDNVEKNRRGIFVTRVSILRLFVDVLREDFGLEPDTDEVLPTWQMYLDELGDAEGEKPV